MRNILYFLILFSFYSTADFSGHWVNEGKTDSFTLDLIRSGEHLTGKYCFITNNGNRIDCEGGGEENIDGVIKGNVATVSFNSTFGGAGKATISIVNDILTYKIDDYTPFVEANMSVPKIIIFNKKERGCCEKVSSQVEVKSPLGTELIFSEK